jgi:hypothetical protein
MLCSLVDVADVSEQLEAEYVEAKETSGTKEGGKSDSCSKNVGISFIRVES